MGSSRSGGAQRERMSQGNQPGGLPPELQTNDNTAEQIKTAIDEDKVCFALFDISVVGSICCWSGCLVMPEWIYWGDKIHGLSFEISGPVFALWAGFVYIRGTGARDRMVLMTAERIAGAAIALQLACWYLVNLRTLKVRIDVNDLSSEYTEQAYTYYVFGCVLILFAMLATLHSVYNRNQFLKRGTDDIKDLDQEWAARLKAAEAQHSKPAPSKAEAPVSDSSLSQHAPSSAVLEDDDDLLEPASL